MKFKLYISASVLLLFLLGCKKNGYDSLSGGTALTIVNAVVGSNSLVTNFLGSAGSKVPDTLEYYGTAAEIGYGGFMEFSGYIGPTSLSLSPITDTMISLWNGVLTLPMNTIHSLFFIGPDSLHIDTLFTVDNPPPHQVGDSTVGVRFVNLAPGSNPVSVDIQGNSPGSEVANLPYKGVTSFIDCPVNAESPTFYYFEFRDAGSGTLLTRYKMNGLRNGTNGNTSKNLWRWRNVTICIAGVPGGQGTILVNDY